MVKLSINTYNGQSSVTMTVQDYRASGIKQNRIIAAMQTYDRYCRGESLPPAHYRAICPTREECAAVYKAVPAQGIPLERLMLIMYAQGMNYCKMRICLDIFSELGLVQTDGGESRVRRSPVTHKVDLHSSKILTEMERRVREVMV
jgi:single-stranded-DNA-specific exonuclease